MPQEEAGDANESEDAEIIEQLKVPVVRFGRVEPHQPHEYVRR